MSKILLIFLVGLLASASAIDLAQSACQYIVSGGSIYNFYGFLQTNQTYEAITGDELVTFDLCSTDVQGCTSSTVVTAKAVGTTPLMNEGDCTNLADTNSPTTSYLNASNPQDGISIAFPAVNNGNVNYTVTFLVGCNSSVDMNQINWTISTDITGTQYTISGAGAPGCPIFTIESYLEFFNEYKYLFASFCLLIGLFALLAGLRFFNVTIFIFGTIVTTAALFIIILTFTGLEISTGAQWGIFAGCLIAGLGCGYGAVKLEKAGFFALGALFGGICGLFLYGLVLHFFDLGKVALYVIIVVLALIGGGLALWLWKDIIIISTSCIGAYLIIRALSFYIGGFPNELDVVQGIETYNYVDYVYLAAMIIVAIGGVWFQYKRKKKDQENEKEINTETELNESITRY